MIKVGVEKAAFPVSAMTPAEIEAVLQAAFDECAVLGYPLSTQQREILFRTLMNRLMRCGDRSKVGEVQFVPQGSNPVNSLDQTNPLTQLSLEHRQALLQFIREQTQQHRSWKAHLLNDWLHNRDSGAMQFVRDLYGLAWLERVQPEHIAEYAEETPIILKVGDRIEVSNALWEWVQDNGPCSREWFPCTVADITEVFNDPTCSLSGYDRQTNCTIRFDNGMEYEIHGVYEWNRYNWRWTKP